MPKKSKIGIYLEAYTWRESEATVEKEFLNPLKELGFQIAETIKDGIHRHGKHDIS